MNENSKLAPIEANPVVAVLEAHVEEIDAVSKLGQDLFIGMSRFQIENFALNNIEYPTPEEKVKHCIHELWERYKGMLDMITQWENNRAKAQLFEARARKFEKEAQNTEITKFDRDIILAKAKLARNRFGQLERSAPMILIGAKATMRELLCFYHVYNEARRDVVFDDYEESELGNWLAKSIMRIKYAGGKGVPPWTGEGRAKLAQLEKMLQNKANDEQLLNEAMGRRVVQPNGGQVIEFGKKGQPKE